MTLILFWGYCQKYFFFCSLRIFYLVHWYNIENTKITVKKNQLYSSTTDFPLPRSTNWTPGLLGFYKNCFISLIINFSNDSLRLKLLDFIRTSNALKVGEKFRFLRYNQTQFSRKNFVAFIYTLPFCHNLIAMINL